MFSNIFGYFLKIIIIFQGGNPKKKYHLTIHERAQIIHFCDQNPNLSNEKKAQELRILLNRTTLNVGTVITALRKRHSILDLAYETYRDRPGSKPRVRSKYTKSPKNMSKK